MTESDLARFAQSLRTQKPESPMSPDSQQLCGDIDMRIARDGTWFYHGSPIGRKPLVKLFAGVLARDAHGDFWLKTPVEKARIQVDDAPFTAVEMFVRGEGMDQCLQFRTNVDDIVALDADHPLRVAIDVETGEPAPYLKVRDGLEALIVRAVFYDLVDLGVFEDRNAEIEGSILGIWSSGLFFALGSTEGD